MSNITTREEATLRYIIEPIEGSGEVEDARAEYDVDAIFDETMEWDEAYDVERNAYMLDQQGYRLRPEFLDEVSGEDLFWGVVAKYAKDSE